MGVHDQAFVFSGGSYDGLHIPVDRGHHRRAHVWLNVGGVKCLEIVDAVKINQYMTAFPGGDFDAGDAEDIRDAGQPDRPFNGIVVGDGHANAQFSGTLGDFFHRIGPVGMAGMEVKIDHRVGAVQGI